MAVARKLKTTKEQLVLDNGDILNVILIRSGFNVGEHEQFAEAAAEAPYHARRAAKITDKLRAAIDEAIDEGLPEEEYNLRLQALRDHTKKQEMFLETVDLGIRVMIAEWDQALTEEDEKAGNFVPLTPEGLLTLHPLLRMDIFSKALDKSKGRTEEEKKDSSENSNGDFLTLMDGKEVSPLSGSDTSSPCDTVANDLMRLNGGASLSTTKPS
jgi:hypothetical protein